MIEKRPAWQIVNDAAIQYAFRGSSMRNPGLELEAPRRCRSGALRAFRSRVPPDIRELRVRTDAGFGFNPVQYGAGRGKL
jgi:hypothetical protein